MNALTFAIYCTIGMGFTLTNCFGKPSIYFLDESSQSNISFTVCDMSHPLPCPVKYTNRLSNTNLFTLEEQNLLKEIPSKYKSVTTNVGPPGSELVRLDQGEFTSSNLKGIIGHFIYPGGEAVDDILFLSNGDKYVKHQSTPGNGYYAEIGQGILCSYEGLARGKMDGLVVTFYNDRVAMWMHFKGGKAVGKFLLWGPTGPDLDSDGLAVEAQFKEPYDFLKYNLMGGDDVTMIDRPDHLTNLWHGPAK